MSPCNAVPPLLSPFADIYIVYVLSVQSERINQHFCQCSENTFCSLTVEMFGHLDVPGRESCIC